MGRFLFRHPRKRIKSNKRKAVTGLPVAAFFDPTNPPVFRIGTIAYLDIPIVPRCRSPPPLISICFAQRILLNRNGGTIDGNDKST